MKGFVPVGARWEKNTFILTGPYPVQAANVMKKGDPNLSRITLFCLSASPDDLGSALNGIETTLKVS
jgi:hypothetical protein